MCWCKWELSICEGFFFSEILHWWTWIWYSQVSPKGTNLVKVHVLKLADLWYCFNVNSFIPSCPVQFLQGKDKASSHCHFPLRLVLFASMVFLHPISLQLGWLQLAQKLEWVAFHLATGQTVTRAQKYTTCLQAPCLVYYLVVSVLVWYTVLNLL